jgi:1-hydroxycarotenoid 3,4-desaturase
MNDVVVIGAGMGGLAAAIELAAAGCAVEVVEAADGPGGKAAEVRVDGVPCDTGPTVLTLPDVARQLFLAAGTRLEDEVSLRVPDTALRVHLPDGSAFNVHHAVDDTLASVERARGSAARQQLERFLSRARTTWEASADAFVYGPHPTPFRVLAMGPRRWWSLGRIDAHRSLWSVVCDDIDDVALRWLMARFATYNGSDPRTAPGTLSCIAWVELGLGVWGVDGGLHGLARALERVARRLGVRFRYGTPVRQVLHHDGAVTGVRLDDETLSCDAVVCNADVAHLFRALLDQPGSRHAQRAPSTSGWVGIVAATPMERAAHEVIFPDDYLEEFVDLFDRRRAPADPTVTTCALSVAHGRPRFDDGREPLYVMVNAPADADEPGLAACREATLARLRSSGRIGDDDPVVWERGPRGLAQQYPDTEGSIYGADSSSVLAAFRRPPNRLPELRGLYAAGGSAHPGGGVPLCLQSGRRAARELLDARGR